MKRILIAVATLLLAACATSPRFDTSGVATELNPQEAARLPDRAGTRVLWGGVIVQGINAQDASRIEVLGYPLDSNQRPDTDEPPLGRFIVQRQGYLEMADYAPGKLLTVVGGFTRVLDGQVGEAPYRFPVVAGERMYLWPRQSAPTEPRLHFGLGVIFSR